jgi:hypothetical protein|tara:strand:- start:119 stop:352 length:234 start_codon:yes stop_codon:yes gene_type:complete
MEPNIENGVWLDEIAALCITTLSRLNNKLQQGDISQNDSVLREICLGYLYMLTVCNEEGVLPQSILSNKLNKNITIH